MLPLLEQWRAQALKPFRACRQRFLRQRIEGTLEDNGARIARDDEAALKQGDGLYKLTDHERFFKLSIFDAQNEALTFTFGEAGRTWFPPFESRLHAALSGILKTERTRSQPIRLQWAHGVRWTTEAAHNPTRPWQDFRAFGEWVYEEHLRDDSGHHVGKKDDAIRQRRLAEHFNRELRAGTCSAVLCLRQWCGRYSISVSDGARRASACAFLAKQQISPFDDELMWPVNIESIDAENLARVEQFGDTYILLASHYHHAMLKQLIHETHSPMYVGIPRWGRGRHAVHDVRLYWLLKEASVRDRIFSSSHRDMAQKLFDAAIHQRAVLKPQLDALCIRGYAPTLLEYVDWITRLWRAPPCTPG
jgi:hypothetical protein